RGLRLRDGGGHHARRHAEVAGRRGVERRGDRAGHRPDPGGAAEHPVWPRSRPARLDAPHLLTGASAATCDSGGAPLSRLMRRLGTARRIDGTAAGGVEPPADSQDALAPGRTWPHSTGEEWREAVCALDPAIL